MPEAHTPGIENAPQPSEDWYTPVPPVGPERIAAIRARRAAATPGPWRYENGAEIHGPGGEHIHYVTDAVAMADDDPPLCSFHFRADAEFVANAPDDVTFLLDCIDGLETRLNEVSISRDRFEGEASDLRLSWKAKHEVWLEARAEAQRLRERLAAVEPAQEAS